MNKQTLVIIIIALVILLAGWLLFSGQPASAPEQIEDTVALEDQTDSSALSDATTGEGSRVISIPAPVAPVITYIDTGYTPNVLRVARGTTVTFQNGHTVGMWTASDAHPTHGNYPATGGCISSTFDSCRAVPAGESWSFTFDLPGTWTYHNHVRSSDHGTIIVE